MHALKDLPEIVFVRVRTQGGPYRVGDRLSVAFITPGVARLATHESASDSANPFVRDPIVPESITVDVTMGAGPYASGDSLTLSFVDPEVARIHPSAIRVDLQIGYEHVSDERDESLPSKDACSRTRVDVPEILADRTNGATSRDEYEHPNDEPRTTGVRVTLRWDFERRERFVRVVDKLFAVDRLGWYRHVLAVRLLVPDAIVTGNATADGDASRQLAALRTAVARTLGRPLVAACMPNFSVTADWLDELDSVDAARAMGALREAIVSFVDDAATLGDNDIGAERTIGIVTRSELLAAPSTSVEALLPIFIPCRSLVPALSQTLSDYRVALSELFAQTADSTEAVRLNSMAQSNHVLDDRLWRLVGAVGESFASLPVA